MFIQCQEVVTDSAPSLRNKKSGRRLTKKAKATAVFTEEVAQSCLRWVGVRACATGAAKMKIIRSRLEVIMIGVDSMISCYLDLHQELLVPKTNG